jgi:hypothetical protein
MTDLAKLTVKLEAQSEKLTKELAKSNKKLDRFSKRANKNLDGVAKSFKRVGIAAAAVSAGIGAFGYAVKRIAESADQMQKFGIKVGITTDNLSRLKHAADLSGVGFNSLLMAMQRSTRRISEAAQGTGEAVNALKELGLPATRLNDLSPDQQLLEIADAMSSVEKQSDRVRLAMKLFDSEGVSLIQMLQGGSKALEGMMRDSDRLGSTLRQVDADNFAKMNDAIERSKKAITGFAIEIAANVAPAFTKWIESATEGMIKFRERADFADKIRDSAAKSVKTLGQVMSSLGTIFNAMEKAVAYIESNPTLAKYGLVGWLVRGRKGIVEGVGLGKVIEIAQEGRRTTAESTIDRELEKYQKTLEKIEEVNQKIASYSQPKTMGGAISEFFKGESFDDLTSRLEFLKESAGHSQQVMQEAQDYIDAYDAKLEKSANTSDGISTAIGILGDTLKDAGEKAKKFSSDYERGLENIEDKTVEVVFNVDGVFKTLRLKTEHPLAIQAKDNASEIIKMIRSEFEKLKFEMEEKIEVNVEMKGKGSTERYLSEKIHEMSGKFSRFASNVSAMSPKFTIDATEAMDSLGTIGDVYAQQLEKVARAIKYTEMSIAEGGKIGALRRRAAEGQEKGELAALAFLESKIGQIFEGRNTQGGMSDKPNVTISEINIYADSAETQEDWRQIVRNNIIPELEAVGTYA